MPPRFRDESIVVMNQVLLRRVPDCIYTAEDIAELQQSEGLDDAQIIIFAQNFRARTKKQDRLQSLTLGTKQNHMVTNQKMDSNYPVHFMSKCVTLIYRPK
jgi:hypothetical protein